jgi:rubrerythrin
MKKTLPLVIGFLLLSASVYSHTEAVEKKADPQNQTLCPDTILVLKKSFASEAALHRRYLAFAEKARAEGYPNVAYLFVGLACSEQIHARNFKRVLSALGVAVKEPPASEIDTSDTRENLKTACTLELMDIDYIYPNCIERAKKEGNADAIRDFNFAWEPEKQHRDLIEKIQSGTGIFFGVLTKKIGEKPVEYFVCQTCGSTVIELPKRQCPVCKDPPSAYSKIAKK